MTFDLHTPPRAPGRRGPWRHRGIPRRPRVGRQRQRHGRQEAGGGDLPRRAGRPLPLAARGRPGLPAACADHRHRGIWRGRRRARARPHLRPASGHGRDPRPGAEGSRRGSAPAIATPDRERSHFEAQDVLESGAAGLCEPRPAGSTARWRPWAARQGQGDLGGPDGAADPARAGEAASWSPGARARPITACRPSCRISTPTTRCWARRWPRARHRGHGQGRPGRRRPGRAGHDAGRLAHERTADAGGAALRPVLRRVCGNAASWAHPGRLHDPAQRRPGGRRLIDGFDTHANQGAAEGRWPRAWPISTPIWTASRGLRAGVGDTVVRAWPRIRPHRPGQRHQGHRPWHGIHRPGAGRRPKAGGIIGDWPTLARRACSRTAIRRRPWTCAGLFKGVLRDHIGIDARRWMGCVFPGSGGVTPVKGLV